MFIVYMHMHVYAHATIHKYLLCTWKVFKLFKQIKKNFKIFTNFFDYFGFFNFYLFELPMLSSFFSTYWFCIFVHKFFQSRKSNDLSYKT